MRLIHYVVILGVGFNGGVLKECDSCNVMKTNSFEVSWEQFVYRFAFTMEVFNTTLIAKLHEKY